MSSEFEDLGAALQSELQQATPFAESLPSGPPNPGWFRKGEPGPALRHGGRSRLVAAGAMPEQAEARAALAERVAAIVADLGGPDVLSTLGAGQVDRHARLELVDTYLWANLERLGPLTGKGRTRAALTAWLAVVDRLQKSATTLGLERKSKHVDTFESAIAREPEAR
jgi:hypothetical protein